MPLRDSDRPMDPPLSPALPPTPMQSKQQQQHLNQQQMQQQQQQSPPPFLQQPHSALSASNYSQNNNSNQHLYNIVNQQHQQQVQQNLQPAPDSGEDIQEFLAQFEDNNLQGESGMTAGDNIDQQQQHMQLMSSQQLHNVREVDEEETMLLHDEDLYM